MLLHKEYYSNKLYPLQDAVLSVVAKAGTDFYLTGGTALSRNYLHHRFSDDLDFFVNGNDQFSLQVEKILSDLGKTGKAIHIDKRAEDFVRIHIDESATLLKIDFVNDIPYHSGSIISSALFPNVDGWWNILSNKITALDRREPKDVADILFMCRTYAFRWEDVFEEAGKKTTYIDPLDISVILSEFPKEYFSKIQWINEIDVDACIKDLTIIAKDILRKEINSLAGTM
jgi:hypothetical protein